VDHTCLDVLHTLTHASVRATVHAVAQILVDKVFQQSERHLLQKLGKNEGQPQGVGVA